MVMVERLGDYWPLVLVAVLVLALLAFVILRPRQRVRLNSDSAPVRPHMAHANQRAPGEGRGLAGEAAAAASDVTGELLGAPVHRTLAGEDQRDEFCRMKGVGPKFADALHAQGFARFEQLAQVTPEEIDRLDTHLGAFHGRLKRDRVPEQADYLARGDIDGYEARFGKL
jgi:predicted flap endonuclease-1-like 5' DNA nuclease